MRPRWIWLPVGAGLGFFALWSCVQTPDKKECVTACNTAGRCGMLPSALGGSSGHSLDANIKDCIARCEASDVGTKQVQGLLDALSDPLNDDTLCRPNGKRACEELIEELEEEATTSELSVTADLTVRMTSALSHASTFSLESWCCYDYDYDIFELPEDYRGDGINEIAAVHDMFEPTFACLTTLFEAAQEADVLHSMSMDPMMPTEEPMDCMAMDPMAPDFDPTNPKCWCRVLDSMWFTTPPNETPDPLANPCYYARQTSRLTELDIDAKAMECSAESVRELSMELGRTIFDWRLEPGDILVDDQGQVRDAQVIQQSIQAEIRHEIDRPMGFLENACEELYEELGDDACDVIDRGKPLPQDDCSGGPVCSEADCLAGSDDCNAELCDADVSPPSRDCGFFGITEVRLGYRTNEGVELFGDPISGCASRDEIASTFTGVRIGEITPVAVVSGSLGSSVDPDGDTIGDGSFSWYVEGNRRWVSAGDAELELASPLLEFFENVYGNPLEYLGWVPQRFPIGQACDNQPALCEGLFNDNCEDGIDNGVAGLADTAAPWCDRLFEELVDRCIVAEPGRALPAECRYDPGGIFEDEPPEPGDGEPPSTGASPPDPGALPP